MNGALDFKGAKEAASEDSDGTVVILDAGCRKAMCGLSNGQVKLLPDSSTFNFANAQQALASEKCRVWFSYEPPLLFHYR